MTTHLALAAAALLVAGCASTGTSPAPAPGTTTSTPAQGTRPGPAPLRFVHDPGRVTGTITGPCHVRDDGKLPDNRCTPGAIDPQITAAQLCARGYSTRSYRAPESQIQTLKRHVLEPAYGLADIPGVMVVDHLVELEDGGANDAANLWMQPVAVSRAKDRVEDRVHAWVCGAPDVSAAQDRLTMAQRAMATDWTTAEAKLGLR